MGSWQVATGFTVHPGELAGGSGKVTEQGQQCTDIATAVAGAIAEMAGAAGESVLADALVSASQAGTSTFLTATELYSYVAASLTRTAAGYQKAEHLVIRNLAGLW